MEEQSSSFPSSAPLRTKAHGSKVLFWYLRLFFTLGLTAGAVSTVWYQVINKFYPLAITPYGIVRQSFNYSATVWAIAMLIVAGPIFFLFATIIRGAIKKDEVELDVGVRPWVSYVFLFIVAAILIVDLITFFRYMINGDYSTRFILKSLVILVVSGWIISYVWLGLRAADALVSSRLPRVMGIAAAVVMLGSVAAGFSIIDSPALARAKTFDQRRSYDLNGIVYAVDNYYTENKRMPESLEQLSEGGWIDARVMEDPKTGEAYSYRILEGRQYELCATFVTDSKAEEDDMNRYRPTGRTGKLFLHGAEMTCYEFSAR